MIAIIVSSIMMRTTNQKCESIRNAVLAITKQKVVQLLPMLMQNKRKKIITNVFE